MQGYHHTEIITFLEILLKTKIFFLIDISLEKKVGFLV